MPLIGAQISFNLSWQYRPAPRERNLAAAQGPVIDVKPIVVSRPHSQFTTHNSQPRKQITPARFEAPRPLGSLLDVWA